ncbi:hypothetical protein [Caballeronia sordidicola]|uniref:Uncharacterized protein n=1 Tax=Caballeronia sordidicola TaxID=196367 RepID=A0A226X8P0_CABSO|nr:hypothetical protein [Caballeronia sordidicola]OXC79340.1 hypothetical protein BSU04_07420 [Caballeronia sordidicola]
MFTLAIVSAVVAVTVLAYVRRNSVSLWIAVLFAWGNAIPFMEAQFAVLAHSAWSSWLGA